MHIFRLPSYPIEHIADVRLYERELAMWWTNQIYPTRIIALTRPFSMHTAVQRVQQHATALDAVARHTHPLVRAIDAWIAHPTTALSPYEILHNAGGMVLDLVLQALADLPDLQDVVLQADTIPQAEARTLWGMVADVLDTRVWRLPWMHEMIRLYESLEQQYLVQSDYFMMTWEPSTMPPTTIERTLSYRFRRPVRQVDTLPTIIRGSYTPRDTCLEPTESGLPWYAVLHSYEVQGECDATTLHPLLYHRHLGLAVDIRTMTRTKARRILQFARNAAVVTASDQSLNDTRAENLTTEAKEALHELREQTLHELQFVILVSGETREQVEEHVEDVKTRCAPQLSVTRLAGEQLAFLEFFSTKPRAAIRASIRPVTQLSHAVGCVAGVTGLHRATDTDGILLGIDMQRLSAVFSALFIDRQAAHFVVLGKSGYGKTVFFNILTERCASLLGYQVIGLDSFSNGVRIANHLGGAACYEISPAHTVNILDVVYPADAEGGWLDNQVMHVIGQLQLLLGETGYDQEHNEVYIPRMFTIRERGVLGRSLRRMYTDLAITPETPLPQMPILQDLIQVLEQQTNSLAQTLATDLRYLLYGTDDPAVDATDLTTEGRMFNGHTTIDWNFLHDVVYYDFKHVPRLQRPFFYLQAMAAIIRYLNLPADLRDHTRPIVLLIDEYAYMALNEAVSRLAWQVVKTARKYLCALGLADQNPGTFTATESGRQILENMANQFFFHLEEDAAQQVADLYPVLKVGYDRELPSLQAGQCVAMLRGDVYKLNIETHALEQHAFFGS